MNGLANKPTGANSRPASPLDAGRQFGCASCAPLFPSAAVAQFGRYPDVSEARVQYRVRIDLSARLVFRPSPELV